MKERLWRATALLRRVAARLRGDAAAVAAAVVAVTLTWYAGWIALEAVSVAGALLLTAWSVWLLRQDRVADYQRSLVPWVTVQVGDYDASYQYIPLEVTALGSGTAYNVIVNLFQKHPPGGGFFIAEPVLPQLSAGEHTEVRIAIVSRRSQGSSRSDISTRRVVSTSAGTPSMQQSAS